MELTEEIARKFARIALGHVGREYPNSPQHIMAGDEDARTPRDLHPAFFGSFDWHSCVHSWWMLLTLRRLYPHMPEAREIEALADTTFTAKNMSVELAYFERPTARGFERPYGWAWLLYLHAEAAKHEDKEWSAHLEPFANTLGERLREYLEVLTYPITVGTHFNTAFALVLANEWAERFAPQLSDQIASWACQRFSGRSDYRGWEPGGDEFLSPVLAVAQLMSRVEQPDDFAPWFDALVVANGWLEQECRPVTVSDRSDGKIAHLDGLNLSRAWCLRGIGRVLGEGAPSLIAERAQSHLAASLPHIAGDYAGEHWLASFATLALLEAD